MYKFLVIQTAFTGDVVLATSIVEKIHQFYPDAQIDFLLRKGNEGLLHGHPYITNLLVWNKQDKKHINLVKMALRVRREKYTHIINPHRFFTSGFICFTSGAGYTAGYDKNPFSFSFTKKVPHIISPPRSEKFTTETGRYQLLLEDITDSIPALPKLHPSEADFKFVEQYKTKPFIAIAPSSVWFTKRYPIDRWVELIGLLPEKDTIYILGGVPDAGIGEEILGKIKRDNVINLCGSLNYLKSAALMQDAEMNYANDSAPLHFASAMDAPVTGVFCSTITSFGFGPQSRDSKIVEVDYDLYCKPCGLHGRKSCPEGHFKCATDIKNEQLLWWTSKTT